MKIVIVHSYVNLQEGSVAWYGKVWSSMVWSSIEWLCGSLHFKKPPYWSSRLKGLGVLHVRRVLRTIYPNWLKCYETSTRQATSCPKTTTSKARNTSCTSFHEVTWSHYIRHLRSQKETPKTRPTGPVNGRQAAADHAAAATVEGTAVARWSQGVARINQAPGKATAARHVAPPGEQRGLWHHGMVISSINIH